MKKIMMALAAIAMAISVQAGAVKWAPMTGIYTAGTKDVALSGATLQLIAVAAGTSVDTVFASVKGGTFTAAKSLTTDTNGKVNLTFDYTNGSYDFYNVCIAGDNFYMSASVSKSVGDVGTAGISTSLKATSNTGTLFDADKGYQGAGWYSTVPEPTSGLLLLLGMAGLALKRKQA